MLHFVGLHVWYIKLVSADWTTCYVLNIELYMLLFCTRDQHAMFCTLNSKLVHFCRLNANIRNASHAKLYSVIKWHAMFCTLNGMLYFVHWMVSYVLYTEWHAVFCPLNGFLCFGHWKDTMFCTLNTLNDILCFVHWMACYALYTEWHAMLCIFGLCYAMLLILDSWFFFTLNGIHFFEQHTMLCTQKDMIWMTCL